MISATAEYALRAIVFLAGQKEDVYTGRLEIAESTGVPIDYLLKVLNALDSAELVESKRGPGGGYMLRYSPKELTVLDVVHSVDESSRIKRCPLGIAGHEKLCRLHALLDNAGRLIEESFQETTIQDLISSRRVQKSCEFPPKP